MKMVHSSLNRIDIIRNCSYEGILWIYSKVTIQEFGHYATGTLSLICLRVVLSRHDFVQFGFFVWWHINLLWLFNAKAILREGQSWYDLTHSWEDKEVHTFSKGICPKGNVIARLMFEPAYYDFTVQHFNHYLTQSCTLTIKPRGHLQNDLEWFIL